MDKTKWVVDPDQSSIQFDAGQIKGVFHSYDAVIEADPGNLVAANIAFSVDLSSLDTGSENLDNRLLGEEFFDIGKFPDMRFIVNNILDQENHEYELVGDFSLHGVTKTESIFAVFKGEAEDPETEETSSFQAKGVIKRSEYGLSFSDMSGDEVQVLLRMKLKKES